MRTVCAYPYIVIVPGQSPWYDGCKGKVGIKELIWSTPQHHKPHLSCISYTPGREYRVAGNRYSRLLFTSEDRLCAESGPARTIDEYDVTILTMPVPLIRLTLQNELWWRQNAKSEKTVKGRHGFTLRWNYYRCSLYNLPPPPFSMFIGSSHQLPANIFWPRSGIIISVKNSWVRHHIHWSTGKSNTKSQSTHSYNCMYRHVLTNIKIQSWSLNAKRYIQSMCCQMILSLNLVVCWI